MKFSYNWLAELVDGCDISAAELSNRITIKTAESEGVHEVQGDWVIEIDNKSLTHRPDLWGHHGMAREVAAITGARLLDPVHRQLPGGDSPVRVEIDDYKL